jgi:hypothetical protein
MGRNDFENHPDLIKSTLGIGFDVEVDIWFVDGRLFLGHDGPEYLIDYDFLLNDGLWIHCKNVESFEILKDNSNPNNYFYHQNDDFALTSLGYLWTYPGQKLTKYSIAVMPEMKEFKNIKVSYGICSDFISDKKYTNL